MNTWLDLEKRFRDIAPTLSDVRLDHNWGDGGEHWNIAGGFRSGNLEQFKILVQLAGQLLEKSLPKEEQLLEKIMAEDAYERRWFRAVWETTNNRENFLFGTIKDDEGKEIGHIYSAMIYNVVDVSANLCLRLHALYPVKEENRFAPNINISGATIGILNTGKIEDAESISINITNLREMGQEQIATAIEKLAEAIKGSNELENIKKQEFIEQLGELSNQATLSSERRLRPSVLKSLTATLAASLSTVSDIAQIWSVWGPIIIAFFSR